jgi:hypothetical protein
LRRRLPHAGVSPPSQWSATSAAPDAEQGASGPSPRRGIPLTEAKSIIEKHEYLGRVPAVATHAREQANP